MPFLNFKFDEMAFLIINISSQPHNSTVKLRRVQLQVHRCRGRRPHAADNSNRRTPLRYFLSRHLICSFRNKLIELLVLFVYISMSPLNKHITNSLAD